MLKFRDSLFQGFPDQRRVSLSVAALVAAFHFGAMALVKYRTTLPFGMDALPISWNPSEA